MEGMDPLKLNVLQVFSEKAGRFYEWVLYKTLYHNPGSVTLVFNLLDREYSMTNLPVSPKTFDELAFTWKLYITIYNPTDQLKHDVLEKYVNS